MYLVKQSLIHCCTIFRDIAAKENVTLKAGDTLTVEANVEGEPPAHEIVWTLAGKELVQGAGNGIYIDNSKAYKSNLAKDSLTRRDQGTLTCSATNMEGKSSCSIEVSIVAKPEMPQDRLLVSNISRSSCRLNWKAPKDDGGLPLEYIIEKYTANGDSWAVHVSNSHCLKITQNVAFEP